MNNNIYAFTYQAKPHELELAKQVVAQLPRPVEVYNIPQFKPDDFIHENDFVIAFGATTHRVIEQFQLNYKKNFEVFILPAINLLQKLPGNEDTRKQAMQSIKLIKEKISSCKYQPQHIVITDKDLPDLSARHLLMLQKMTEEAQRVSCFQTSINGKIIEISLKPIENTSADINLTFEEIYTVKQIMDVLHVNEVKLVNHNQRDSNSLS